MGTAAQVHVPPREELDYLLDKTLFGLHAPGSAQPALDELIRGLGAQRVTARTWKRHPLFRCLEQDPFTRRTRTWHGGDAIAMDYIYRGLPHQQRRQTSRIGQAIFEYTAELSSVARAIRQRRDLLAKAIDAAIERTGAPRILAVGCGHLRELSLSPGGATRLGAMYALDADPQCLERVREEHGYVRSLVPVQASVQEVANGCWSARGLDLIYAAHLLEGLDDHTARPLVARLAEMLAPGGRLILANLLPSTANRGLVDGVMAWPVTWRTEDDLARLVEPLPTERIESLCASRDLDETIAYLNVALR